MVKRIKKLVKKTPTRERKRLIVIGTEGNNKTETLYFRELEKKQTKYHFVFANGNETDPEKIVDHTAKKSKAEALDRHHGDLAISVFDLDADPKKVEQLLSAKNIAEKKDIKIITSNPCFEVWYLEHFGFSSKPFTNSHAVLYELDKKIPGYRKDVCNFDVLYPNTEHAIANCESLIKYHEENGAFDDFANPRTEVHKIINFILSENK